MKAKISSSLLLAYYGDDFTGSTDVMESLSRAGLKTVLFLKPPSRAELAKFPGLRAFGIAGGSRAMSPNQMARALPPAFRALKASGARFVHYKTCSTFDSSPRVGSIGKAIELARRTFGECVTPLVVGVPVLGRYVVFGNLFARSGLDTDPSRLDRHPTMSRHPVTPMDEADLRLHLARQTRIPIQLIDLLALRNAEHNGKHPHLSATKIRGTITRPNPPVLLFDTLDDSDLPMIGEIISSLSQSGEQLFCAGSSGIGYALVAHWRDQWLLPGNQPVGNGSFQAPSHIISISGSCSPVTDRQIQRALDAGFVGIPCDSRLLAVEGRWHHAVEKAIGAAGKALAARRSVIFHTARGPNDPRASGFELAARNYAGASRAEKLARAGATLGKGLAEILHRALLRTGAKRVVVCGGDTSTHVSRALGIEALEFIASFTPGAPRCLAHSRTSPIDLCDVIFKGGQTGRDSFFCDLAKGGSA